MAGYVSMNPIPANVPSDIRSDRGPAPPTTIENATNDETRTQVDPIIDVTSVRDAAVGAQEARLELDNAVLHARSMGVSWAKVGAAVGISRQSAHNRWSTKQ